ncbi:response regulator transcription factor [Candidatus Dojkabacteria bacterium]|uniref:Response regulator transcription factor n=1 Tax=Candidatus Dojkabacteria bacterium TaxID=2099670 RepID=A0A955L4F3_9BACT|nr:response regulator transcription factor [Candidatus Dojkabacteria bacterium]
MYKILIIEDNNQLAETIRDYFTSEQYQFTIENNGLKGLQTARNNTYDLILLDVVLPERNGFYIAKALREQKIEVPILMMTEKNQVEDIEEGFSKGVDAYLPKPFNLRELKARINGLLKRPPSKKDAIIKFNDIEINTDQRTVTRDGIAIGLRKKEFDILHFLVANKGRVITRDQILNNIWSIYSEPFSGTVDVHLSNIRRKLNIGGKPNIIRTIHGVGFIVE